MANSHWEQYNVYEHRFHSLYVVDKMAVNVPQETRKSVSVYCSLKVARSGKKSWQDFLHCEVAEKCGSIAEPHWMRICKLFEMQRQYYLCIIYVILCSRNFAQWLLKRTVATPVKTKYYWVFTCEPFWIYWATWGSNDFPDFVVVVFFIVFFLVAYHWPVMFESFSEIPRFVTFVELDGWWRRKESKATKTGED